MEFIAEYGPGNPDPRPGLYYVSVVDGRRYALALGPFDTHAEALDAVEPVRRYANEQSDRAWFYGFGTSRIEVGAERPEGKLNGAPGLASLLP